MSEKTIAFTVDEEFHKAIKVRTAETGQFLKSYIINLIRKDLDDAKKIKNNGKREYTIEDALKKENELREILTEIATHEKE